MSPLIVINLVLVLALLLFSPVPLPSLANPPDEVILNSINWNMAVAPLPVSRHLDPPSVSARNIFILDQLSRTVLFSRNATDRVLPASTTKMMTALISLDYYRLEDIFTVNQSYPIGNHIGFLPGEQLSVEQLLYSLLVQSANDAAEILAENFPGGDLPAGRVGFVAAMNAKAAQIHLNNTRFTNPTGIDEAGHYSTAADLARLADYALRNENFAKMVATENAIVSHRVLTNVNQLLGKVEGVKGVKTGFTEGAGQSLVTLVERDDHPVIVVVLGSRDRFGDTSRLIDWIYSNHRWIDPRVEDTPPL